MKILSLRVCLPVAVLLSSLCANAAPATPRGEVWVSPPHPAQVWAAKPPPAGAPMETVRGQIVHFRQTNARGGAEAEKVAFGQRYVPGENFSSSGNRWEDILDFDVDGNSSTKDWVQTIPFSLKEPLSPAVPLWENQLVGTRFYGGFTFYYANRKPSDIGVTEKYINSNEQIHNMQPANDWALHHQPTKVSPTPFRAYASWLWKKEDFGAGANQPGAKVSFDDTSVIGLYCQRYWQGWNGIRFVVQEGDQFYVSEQLPNDFKESKGGSGYFQLRTLTPSQSKWGKWNPKEGDFRMERNPATPMEKHEFKDVQAVGWYLYKDQLDPATVACKWESFECYANVSRPVQPSLLTEMKEIKSAGNEPFYIATTEATYDLWRTIYQWSNNNGQWCLQPRPMTYDKDGDMGSMKFGNLPHTQSEPVTDLTLYDVLAALNAMSEYEGREPVYYTDPAFSRASEYEYVRKPGEEIADDIVQKSKDTVFRTVVWSPFNGDEKLKARPTIYVKWSADGFRLPTPAEWTTAFGSQKSEVSNQKSEKTSPVGAGVPNEAGLYDMIGNVWELVWTYGDKMEPNPVAITVLGGAFYDGDPMKVSASPYGDKPYGGRFDIGFRPVRRAAGLSGPSARISGGIPQWIIKPDDKPASGAPETADIKLVTVPEGKIKLLVDKKNTPVVDMTAFQMAAHETSYRDWKTVYFWALENGYTFDCDGDMGSMDFKQMFNMHTPDEPVTGIGFHDILVWCNALSEMQGKPPVFYTDAEKTKPYHNAFRYRPLEYRNIEHYAVKDRVVLSLKDGCPSVYMRWDIDSYRVPTQAEWLRAYSGGAETKFPWGDSFDGIGACAWYLGNSDLRTHPVAQKKANGFGLYDMAGNALEYIVDGTYKGNAKYKRGQTANPISSFTPYDFVDHCRFNFMRVGFMYEEEGVFETAPAGTSDIWAGAFGNIPYPDVGFRVMTAQKDAYPSTGIDESVKPTPATPLDLARASAPGQAPYGYDPLQGATYRADLMRDGYYRGERAPALKAEKWKYKTGGAVKASPVVVDGMLYVGSEDKNFYAFDALTGSVKWSFSAGAAIYTSATVYKDTVFFVAMNGTLYALDARTGAKKWEQKTDPEGAYDNHLLSPGVAYGVVFASRGLKTSFQQTGWGGGQLVGFDADTGAKVWEQHEETGPDGFNSLAIIDGKIVMDINFIYNGRLDLATGTFDWNNRNSWKNGMFHTPHAVADGKAFVCTAQGGANTGDTPMSELLAIDLNTGRKVWAKMPYDQFELGTTKPADKGKHRCWAPPAVAEGLVYAGTEDGRLHAFDTKNGDLKWMHQAGGAILSAPSVAGGTVYFGCDAPQIVALDAKTGALKSQLLLADKTMSSPCIANGMLFIGDDSGTVFGFE